MKATSHIYPGSHSLGVYIALKDCNKAIEWYKKAFNATERGRLIMPDGKIGHAEIEIEGSMLMMADENPDWGNKSAETIGGNPVGFALYVKDVDTAFKKAIDAGAKEVMPLKDEFYGDRIGQVMDPFGYKWSLTTHQEDVSFEEMQKRMDKMFEQPK
ncbi:Dot/Icm type IV secretion system effector PhnB [soil metagenome]